MNERLIKMFGIFFISVIFWQLSSYWVENKEPWDGRYYLPLWYPLSIILAAFGGYCFGERGWLSGMIVTFAQIPIVIINSGSGPLLSAGVLFLILLAVPPIIISALTGRYAVRQKLGSID